MHDLDDLHYLHVYIIEKYGSRIEITSTCVYIVGARIHVDPNKLDILLSRI